MKKMLDWLKRFIWISEIIFLSASTPHIATYYAHFDNPTDFVSSVYAWGVGYGLALLIDGISFIVLLSMMFSIEYRRPKWLIAFLVSAMLLVSTLSWFINWQYNVVFTSNTFTSADKISVFRTTIGSLNPIIGGAFPFLSVLYALVAKAIEVDDVQVNKAAMTPEQFEMEKTRIAQEHELKALKSAQRSGKGWLSLAQETVMGQSSDAEELLNRALCYLRDARDLLPMDQEERALQALSVYLKMREKAVQPLLIQARSILIREEEEERNRQVIEEEERRKREAIAEEEERKRKVREEEERQHRQAIAEEEERIARIQAEKEERIERLRLEHEAAMRKLQIENEQRLREEQTTKEVAKRQAKESHIQRQHPSKGHSSEVGLIDDLKGDDAVSLETAALVLGYEDTRYVVRLCTQGRLKHRPNREDLITVASLRAYLAKHPKRTGTPLTIVRDVPTEARAVADQEALPDADQETTA